MKYYSKPFFKKKYSRPPELYEYFVDNFWFKTANLENEVINEPLRGSLKADIVILGGGYTGLSSAYHLAHRFPDKKIMLLEGACCGYGASGRNGGFCIISDLLDEDMKEDPDKCRKTKNVSFYGLNFIKKLKSEHNVDCDLQENGTIDLATNEKEARILEKEYEDMKSWGFDAKIVQGKELKDEINSPRFIAGLTFPYGATLNPAKLARGMKRVVENAGVEIRERTVVTRVTPGRVHHIDTELGEVKAPVMIIALNGYSNKLGFFQNRMFPICSYIIATEPLSNSQWESIGWHNRRGLADKRLTFNYIAPSADNRIIIGGSDYPYYPNDGLSSGNNKTVTELLIKDLFLWFPQLEGVKIDHCWGGSMSGTLDFTPSVGVMGEHRNIYYGVGYFEGVPTTQTSGRIISDLMAGEENEFTSHYIVNHKIPYAGPKKVRSALAPIAKRLMVKFVRDRFEL